MTIYSISMQIYYDLLWLHGKLIFPSYGKLIVVGNKDVKVSQRISPVGSLSYQAYYLSLWRIIKTYLTDTQNRIEECEISLYK